MEFIKIEQLEMIMLIGAIVAILAKRLKIPYTVGMVIAGIVITFLPLEFNGNFSKPLLFGVLLPPLIFEDAIYLSWKWLRRELPLVMAYATIGVLLSAGVTAVFMHFLVGWTWEAAILFGVLIAATDPVSVIATFKEAKVRGRLKMLVESESLVNDATAAVAFSAALVFAMGHEVSAISSIIEVSISIVGGVFCGLLIGGGILLIVGRSTDDLVDLALTTVAAFGSFWLAEKFHLSGVLATMTAGILIGNTVSFGFFSEESRKLSTSFWKFGAFAVNSIIFVMIGITIASRDFLVSIVPIAIAIVAVLIGRALAIYPVSLLFARSDLKISAAHQHVMVWGGLRGALGLALALGIPDEFPFRQQIILVTFAVVAFSVFVQGLTMKPLLKSLKQVSEG